jgi:hypothetical protein
MGLVDVPCWVFARKLHLRVLPNTKEILTILFIYQGQNRSIALRFLKAIFP